MKKVILLLSITFFAFSCEDQAASLEESDTVRMVIQETQCANPWERASDPDAHKNNIMAYLQSEGITAASVQVLDEQPPDSAFCMACTCWSGNNIYISIPASQVDEAEALGFGKVD